MAEETKSQLIDIQGLQTFLSNADERYVLKGQGTGVTYTLSKNASGEIVLTGSDSSETKVSDANTTYGFSQSGTTLTITPSEGDPITINMGEEITSEKIVAALGYTPADEEDIDFTRIVSESLHHIYSDELSRIIDGTVLGNDNGNSGYSNSYAFDNNANTYWYPYSKSTDIYIGIHSNTPYKISYMEITKAGRYSSVNASMKLQASNDGVEWIDISNIVQQQINGFSFNYRIDVLPKYADTPFSYIRLYSLTSMYNGNITLCPSEICFYGYKYLRDEYGYNTYSELEFGDGIEVESNRTVKVHTHENKEVIDKLSEDENGNLLYNNQEIEPDLSNYYTKSEVDTSLSNKVDKETGKSLISDTEITRLASVSNYDDTVLVGRVKTLEDAGYITKAVSDLTNYYTKSETYTQDEVDELISLIPKFDIEVVTELPTEEISDTTIYLLKTSETETGNLYTEYIYVNSAWEKLGTQTLDLSGYQTKLSDTQMTAVNSGITAEKVSTYDGYSSTISNKVDKVEGKGLSTNDLTDELKTQYDAAEENVIESIKVNGTEVTPTNKVVDITIPKTGNETKISSTEPAQQNGDSWLCPKA